MNFSGGSFSIEDLKGATAGYYVTLLMSNLSDSGGHAINKNNISVTVPGAAVSNLGWSSNPAVAVPASAGTVGTDYVSLGSATTLMRRNSGGGVLGRYSVSPNFRVSIPAYTAAGNYSGTLSVTIIEN